MSRRSTRLLLPGAVALVAGACRANDTVVGAVHPRDAAGCIASVEEPWVVSAPLRASDRRFALAAGCDGGAVVAGEFWGSVRLVEGAAGQLTSVGASDLLVARFGPRGDLLWGRQIGGASARPRIGALASADDGGAVLVGSSAGEVALGSVTPTVHGAEDGLLARYSPTGQVEWGRTLGGAGATVRLDAVARSARTVWVAAGTASGPVVVDGAAVPGPLDAAGNDVLVVAIASDGRIAWTRRAGGPGRDAATAVAARSDGSVLVVGTFDASATFGAGEVGETRLVAAGGIDGFIAALDGGGVLSWARPLGGVSTERPLGVAALADGGALVVGTFDGATRFAAGVDASGTLEPVGGVDVFVTRLDAGGTPAWTLPLGGPGSEDVNALAVAPDGTAFLAANATEPFDVESSGGTVHVDAGSVLVSIRDGAVVGLRAPHGPITTSALSIVPGGVLDVGYFGGTASVLLRADEPRVLPGRGLFLARYSP